MNKAEVIKKIDQWLADEYGKQERMFTISGNFLRDINRHLKESNAEVGRYICKKSPVATDIMKKLADSQAGALIPLTHEEWDFFTRNFRKL